MRNRGIWGGLAVIFALFCFTTAVPVMAQSTGGSFGGGSFGGGSSGGGSSSGSSSSGGGFSGSSYSGSSSGGGSGGGCDMPVQYAVPFILIFAVLMIVNASKPGGFAGARQRAAALAKARLDVSAIRLGIDWRARKVVQGRLSELAKSGQTDSPARLAELLRETIATLRQSRLAWLYANVSNYQPMTAAQAETTFHELAARARAQFRDELIRNADGAVSDRAAPELRAHRHEGEGVVVVTLVVAAKRPIVDTSSTGGVEQLEALLEDMLAVANSNALAAMQVVWSPAAENDRMSTAELEQNYPELQKIDERSIAGRVFCAHCTGPFAMELLLCPHCGAPVSSERPPA